MRYSKGKTSNFSEPKLMRNRSSSNLSSVLLGLLIPLFAFACLALPITANAEYPSAFSSQEVSQEMKGTKRTLEDLGKKLPQLLDAETTGLKAEFVKYDLSGLDLSQADLKGAMFSVSSLKEANLKGANLSDIVAYATRFDNADLSGSSLRNADLLKSRFDGALIEGADFSGAMLDLAQQKSLCERATGKNPETGVDTYDSLECTGLTERYLPANPGA